MADYVVVNVSSPNTPGLRDLQAADRLKPVLVAVRAALDAAVPGGRRVPLLVKIAPDLADADVDAVADLALELGLDGIIATNTTTSRAGLASPAAEVAAAGRAACPGRRCGPGHWRYWPGCTPGPGTGWYSIAAGGVETPDDAWERLRAGADAGPGLYRVRLRRPAVASADARRAGPADEGGPWLSPGQLSPVS